MSAAGVARGVTSTSPGSAGGCRGGGPAPLCALEALPDEVLAMVLSRLGWRALAAAEAGASNQCSPYRPVRYANRFQLTDRPEMFDRNPYFVSRVYSDRSVILTTN
jgi:hypothetical protein